MSTSSIWRFPTTPIFSGSTPLDESSTGLVGTATTICRADHVHNTISNYPVSCTFVNITTTTLTNTNTTVAASGSGAVKMSGGLYTALDTFIGGKINLAAKSASTTNGDLWYDSTQKGICTYENGLKEQKTGIIYTMNGAVTKSNWTTAATILSGASNGSKTFPANYFIVGKAIRIRLKGVFSTTTAAPTLTININLGATTVCSVTGSLTTANVVNAYWESDFDLVCRATGSTSTIFGLGKFLFNNTGVTSSVLVTTTTAAANIATTSSQTLDITAACSAAAAANAITVNQVIIEVLN